MLLFQPRPRSARSSRQPNRTQMSDMWDKRLSIIVCTALFLLVSVNKAYNDGPPVGAAPGVIPSTFSAFGDSRQIANGCNAIAFFRSVTCPSGTFNSGDKGKDI